MASEWRNVHGCIWEPGCVNIRHTDAEAPGKGGYRYFGGGRLLLAPLFSWKQGLRYSRLALVLL